MPEATQVNGELFHEKCAPTDEESLTVTVEDDDICAECGGLLAKSPTGEDEGDEPVKEKEVNEE